MYRWALSAACLDRYALSSTNAQLRKLATVRNAYRVVAVNLFVSLVFPIHILVLYEPRSRNCNISYNYNGSLYNATISIVSTGFIPFLIMLICTFLIRTNLADKRQRREALANHFQRVRTEEQRRDQQALRMLFVQVFLFIIIITPWLAYNVYHVTTLNTANKTLDRIVLEGFLTFLTGTSSLLFAAISFYLYTLTSTMFRGELMIMFRWILHHQRPVNNASVECG